MVVRKKWQIASGGMAAAVALGTGTALAHSEPSMQLPQLRDVVGVSEVTDIRPDIDDFASVTVADLEESAASPLSELSESAASVSEPSEPSQPSEPSVSQQSPSQPSEPSLSQQSVSQPSAPSASIPSAESDD